MGWFDRDGSVTRFFEKLPVAGHIVAGVHILAGNSEHAKRAAATSTNSLITVAATAGGFCVGGPVGAAVGAAIGSSAGIATEYGISKTITDAEVKGDVGDISVSRIVTEVALSAVGGALMAGSGTAAASGVREAGKATLKEVAKETVEKVALNETRATVTEVIKTGAGPVAGQITRRASAQALETLKRIPIRQIISLKPGNDRPTEPHKPEDDEPPEDWDLVTPEQHSAAIDFRQSIEVYRQQAWTWDGAAGLRDTLQPLIDGSLQIVVFSHRPSVLAVFRGAVAAWRAAAAPIALAVPLVPARARVYHEIQMVIDLLDGVLAQQPGQTLG